jgi:hypothetical protein
MRSILCTIPFHKAYFPHTQLFCTHPVVKVARQPVRLCQLYLLIENHRNRITSHWSWTTVGAQGIILNYR